MIIGIKSVQFEKPWEKLQECWPIPARIWGWKFKAYGGKKIDIINNISSLTGKIFIQIQVIGFK